MNLHAALFLSVFSVFIPVSSYAGNETLTTYYPSPSGNYNRLQANFFTTTPSTLKDIQKEYKCSYDPTDGLVPCPAGIIFLDKNSDTLFFSDGARWKMTVSSCVPITACPQRLGCGSDSCGIPCGVCAGTAICSSSTPGKPGTCS